MITRATLALVLAATIAGCGGGQSESPSPTLPSAAASAQPAFDVSQLLAISFAYRGQDMALSVGRPIGGSPDPNFELNQLRELRRIEFEIATKEWALAVPTDLRDELETLVRARTARITALDAVLARSGLSAADISAAGAAFGRGEAAVKAALKAFVEAAARPTGQR